MTTAAEDRLYRRVSVRVLPFLFLLYVVAYLDRVNIGFAKLQMQSDLALSDTVYGLGAGMFFLGYFLFEVPSNLILHRVGARLWIARIVAVWGLISSATLWVDSPASFYTLRFLLGLGEAGFFPGILYYLTQWYPSTRRAQATAWFMAAVPMAGVIGGPLSGTAMEWLDGVQGLKGWQWLFVVEGMPAVALGLATLLWLDDGPSQALWLTPQERALVLARLREDGEKVRHVRFSDALREPHVWGYVLAYFLLVVGLYGIAFWMPQMLHDAAQAGYAQTGWLSALPYAVAVAGMVAVGRHSDHSGERRWHMALSAVAGAVGFIAAVFCTGGLPSLLLAFSLAATGVMAALAVFWPMPAEVLSGRAAAGGIALINSGGNLGGYASPAALGQLKDYTGHMSAGLWLLAAAMFGAALLGLCLKGAQRA